ncbi:MAG: dipeptide epimerase [Bacteroidota bacterium]|nr:dipeptide epimerase [Bacteroidota bacterium]MDP4234581.1 dipeptide epimerase [Bacteroidota bacterium]MDP4243710.1 dipeptide epimerase [Bacteroidota bacterium]MDP4288342.1 dipeptide epimerase [Bacteroidota bacterium]
MKSRIQRLKAEYSQIILRQPFILSIRSATHANIIRWTLTTEAGESFPGESVPVQYVTGETPESVLELAPKLDAMVRGEQIGDWLAISRGMERAFPEHPAARAGVEIALLNAFAAKAGISAQTLLGAAKAEVETDITISRLPNALEVACEAYNDDFRIFKLKVGGGSVEEDLDRIAGIANALPDARFRLDANQSLTVRSTMDLLDSLQHAGIEIELMEQPVPKEDIRALDEVSRLTAVPIIADEGCRNAREAYRLFAETNVQGVNIKLMKSGILGALDTIAIAKAANRKLMIGCMLEGEIGMAASVALACGSGMFDYIDLDGHLLVDYGHRTSLFRANGPKLSTW